jgi:hypothetical protein
MSNAVAEPWGSTTTGLDLSAAARQSPSRGAVVVVLAVRVLPFLVFVLGDV